MSFQDQKNPGNVAGGYKATLNNPRISDSTKQEAEQRLHEMGVDPSSRANGSDRGDPDEIAEGATNQQLGGYKATIANPQVSDDAKQHARKVLDAAGAAKGEYEVDDA